MTPMAFWAVAGLIIAALAWPASSGHAHVAKAHSRSTSSTTSHRMGPARSRPTSSAAPAPTRTGSPVMAVTTTTVAGVPVTTAPEGAAAGWLPGDGTGVTLAEFEAWSAVSHCEEGGDWHVVGPVYSGGLGISDANWVAFGGQRDFGDEWSATPDQQIAVAMRIQSEPPDQHGCDGSW